MKRETVFTNLVWRLGERFGAKLVQFVVYLVLAKLLTPELFGDVALVAVFIEILQLFIESGLGNALIQKKDADDLDFSTVFYFNTVVCVLLFLLPPLVSPKRAYVMASKMKVLPAPVSPVIRYRPLLPSLSRSMSCLPAYGPNADTDKRTGLMLPPP